MSATNQTPVEPPGQGPTLMDGGLSRGKRWLRPVFLLVALGFVGSAAYELAVDWEGREVQYLAGWLAVSCAPLLVAALVQAQAWVLLIDHLTASRVPRGAAITLYLDSQLARYTPGKVGLPIVRMTGAQRLGVTAHTVGGSIFFEMLSWAATGGLLGGCWLLLSGASHRLPWLSDAASLLLVLLALFGLCCLVLVDRRRLPAAVRSILRADGVGALAPWRMPLVHCGYWMLWALHGYLVLRGLAAPGGVALAAAGYFILAPVLGFVVLVAPAGVGVREAVISLGLAPVVGVAPALAAGVASRVASLMADVASWAICRLLGRPRGWT